MPKVSEQKHSSMNGRHEAAVVSTNGHDTKGLGPAARQRELFAEDGRAQEAPAPDLEEWDEARDGYIPDEEQGSRLLADERSTMEKLHESGTDGSPRKLVGVAHPLKSHGGKSYQAKGIIGLMPPRARNSNDPAADDPGWLRYVEPFFGAGAVLLTLDPEGIAEVVNDINGALTNFWDVLKSPVHFAELHRLACCTPVSEVEFERALTDLYDASLSPARRAMAFMVRNRQSRQALGKDFASPVRIRTRRGMDEYVSSWLSAVEGLPAFHERLRRVLVRNTDALKVIRSEDGARTLFYLDPP
jgi:site-specific DNA-adenine methylase